MLVVELPPGKHHAVADRLDGEYLRHVAGARLCGELVDNRVNRPPLLPSGPPRRSRGAGALADARDQPAPADRRARAHHPQLPRPPVPARRPSHAGYGESPRRTSVHSRWPTTDLAPGRIEGVDLALQLRGVVKRFGEVTAVAGLDLDVPAGTCVGCSAQTAPGSRPRCACSPRR